MTAHHVARPGQHRIRYGHGLPVAEGQLRRHRGPHVEDAAHGPVVQRPGQVEQARALGGDRRAPGGQRRDLLAQPLVGGQAGRVHLGEAAAEDQAGRPLRQLLVPQRVERGHPGPGRLEQFGLLGVAEGEGRAAGHGHHRAGVIWFAQGFPRGTGPGGRAGRQGEQRVQVAGGGDQGAHPVDGLVGWGGAFGRGDQAEVPGRRDDSLGPPDHAEDRQAGPGQGVPEQPLVPVRRDLVEDHAGHRGPRVEAGEAGRQRGHRTPGPGRVHHQHHGRAEQPGHVRGRAEIGC